MVKQPPTPRNATYFTDTKITYFSQARNILTIFYAS